VLLRKVRAKKPISRPAAAAKKRGCLNIILNAGSSVVVTTDESAGDHGDQGDQHDF
jgi:hypothetical protein